MTSSVKKADRIETFLGDLEVSDGSFHKCYLGYFECFNAEQYYEAHDVLEHLWLSESGANFAFFKGLIQVAGAFVHLKKQHARPEHPTDGRRLHPAVRLFALGAGNLAPFTPTHMGLDVAALRELCRDVAAGITASGFEKNPWLPGQGPRLHLQPAGILSTFDGPDSSVRPDAPGH
ncbi:MAG: DUF309 domain-containing protein [Terrimicrobiaceae bacterium]